MNSVLIMKVLRYAKAILAAAGAGVGAYIPAAADGQITSGEWWTIIGAVLAGGGIVAAVPNKKT